MRKGQPILRFAGYAALFDRIDRGGDIIAPGAFAQSLSAQRTIPLLWQHDPRRQIGSVEMAQEDVRGLRVVAQISPQAREEADLLRSRTVAGLSFGYRVRSAEGRRPRRLIASAQESENIMLDGDAVVLIDGKAVDGPILDRGGENGGRETVELRYYDIDRDYQIGVQASEIVTGERGLYRSDLPASLNASRARTIAQTIAENRRNAGLHLTFSIAEEAAPLLQPGDVLKVAAHPGLWRLEETEYTPGLIHLSCRSWLPAHGVSADGAGSEFSDSELPDFGLTRFWAIDLSAVPLFAAEAALSLIAAGTGTGWGGASIAIEQQGVQYPVGDVEAGVVAGELVQPLMSSTTMLEDVGSVISVRVLNEDMAFESADDVALSLGQNLIYLHGKILQFTTAEQIGVLHWRLSNLRRGLFGSEAASASTHPVGSPLVLLETDMPRLAYDLGPLEQGKSLRFTAEALHDEEPVEAEVIVGKRGLAPFAPVHANWRREGDSMYLRWIRRPRHYVAWQDDVDMPLAESRELYRIGLPGQSKPIAQSTATEVKLALGELRQLLGAKAKLVVELRQVGDFALSPAISISIPAAALARWLAWCTRNASMKGQ